MDDQFAEYFGTVFPGEPIVLVDFDEEAFEKAFEAYEERQECICLYLAGY